MTSLHVKFLEIPWSAGWDSNLWLPAEYRLKIPGKKHVVNTATCVNAIGKMVSPRPVSRLRKGQFGGKVDGV